MHDVKVSKCRVEVAIMVLTPRSILVMVRHERHTVMIIDFRKNTQVDIDAFVGATNGSCTE